MADCKAELHWHIVMNGRYDWRGAGGMTDHGFHGLNGLRDWQASAPL